MEYKQCRSNPGLNLWTALHQSKGQSKGERDLTFEINFSA